MVDALLGNSEVAFGLAAPYESSPSLHYVRTVRDELEPDHAAKASAAESRQASLKQIAGHPLILYERDRPAGSTCSTRFSSTG